MTTRSNDWLRGFATGRAAGSRFRGEFGPLGPGEENQRDRLRAALAEVLVQDALGNTPGPEELAELQRLAVRNRSGDWDGLALGTIAILDEHFDSEGARAWFATMLAGAGRYEEAVGVEHGFGKGRPQANGFVMLVTALALLGREDEAQERMEALRVRFPSLREDFVAVWDDTPVGREFAQLVEAAPQGDKLPVFFHLPFSGGTSMIVSLKQTVPWAATVEIQRRHGLYQLESALQLTKEEVAARLLVHQHHPFGLRLPGRELTYFTVLRDPVSQLASGFYKRRSTEGIVQTRDRRSATFEDHAEYTIQAGMTDMLARQLVTTHPDMLSTFEKFLGAPGNVRSTHTEEDMFWLEATKGLSKRRLLKMCRETLDDRFHVVGSMQHLAASHLAGAASIGLPVAQRIGHRGKSGQPRSGLPEELENRLRDANSVDQTLYEEYTERFEREFAPLVEAVESPEAATVAPA